MKKQNEEAKNFLNLIRWNKPIGSLLILWPLLTALWAASGGRPHTIVLIVFIIGTFLMRSAGCIMNDFADRHWDSKVERTKERPLTTGAISSKRAILYALALCLFSFALVLLLDPLTIMLSVVAVIMAAIYPFLKRLTHLPQVGLGVVFNWGVIMAYSAEQGGIPWVAWILLLATLSLTVAYDTMYAMVDRNDDVQIGIKSTAILFGKHDRLIIFLLQILGFVFLLIFGLYYQYDIWFYLGLLVAFGFVLYQQWLIKDRLREKCFKAFLNNHWMLLVVFIGVVLSYLQPGLCC